MPEKNLLPTMGHRRNPFRLRRIWEFGIVGAAVLLGVLIYGVVIHSLSANYLSAVANADVMARILDADATYPSGERVYVAADRSKEPARDPDDAQSEPGISSDQSAEVDPLADPDAAEAQAESESDADLLPEIAAAAWLRELGVADPEATLDEISDPSGPLALVWRALTDPQIRCRGGEPPVLRLPTVDRIVDVALQFDDQCNGKISADENESKGPTPSAQWVALLAGQVAGLAPASDRTSFVLDDPLGCTGFFPQFGLTVGGLLAGCLTLDTFFNAPRAEPPEQLLKRLLAGMTFYEQEAGAEASLEQGGLLTLKATLDAWNSVLANPFADPLDSFQLDVEQLVAVVAFELAMIAELQSDPNVAAAGRQLSLFRGYEQFAILCLILTIAGLLGARLVLRRAHSAEIGHIERRLEKLQIEPLEPGDKVKGNNQLLLRRTAIVAEWDDIGIADRSNPPQMMLHYAIDDLDAIFATGSSEERMDRQADSYIEMIDSGRAIIQWGLTTLPAVGFVGTVDGILRALASAGVIGTGDAVERGVALASVSGSLGLAFSTTLFALLGLIVLSFFDSRQEQAEKENIENFREFLFVKVES